MKFVTMYRVLSVCCGVLWLPLFALSDSAIVRQRTVAGEAATELSEEICSVGDIFLTTQPPAIDGYMFTHWSLSTTQELVARDANGKAYDTVMFLIQEKTMATAWYVPEAQDDDDDGLPDGYELYWYGSLEYDGASDTDGDGYALAQEWANGTSPHEVDLLIVASSTDDRVICATGEIIQYNPNGYQLVSITNLSGSTSAYQRPNVVITTDSYTLGDGEFAYWSLNGVPVRDKNGQAIDSVWVTVTNEPVTIVAVTEPNLEKRQKLYWYGTTEISMESDTDGDGYTFAQEIANGTSPHDPDLAITSLTREGYVTYSDGEQLQYNPYSYQLVTITSLTGSTSAYQRPGTVMTTDSYSLGNGDFAYWTMNGVPVRDKNGQAIDSVWVTVTNEQVTIVAVTESDTEKRQKLYWYGTTDISMESDTDGDGYTFAQEIANGTSPHDPDLNVTSWQIEGPITVSTGAQIIYDPFGHVTDCAATVTGYSGTYDGAGHGIIVNVTVPDYGYTVSYSLEEFGTFTTTMPLISEAGLNQRIWYRIEPEDTDEYETTYGYGVVSLTQKSFGADIAASLASTSFTYDGAAKEPAVTVTDATRGETLVQGTDYTVAYANNVNVGTATATVTACGNYTGTKTLTFTIEQGSIPGGGGGDEPGDDPVPAGGLSKFDATYVYDGLGHTIDTNKLVAAFGGVAGIGDFSVQYAAGGGAPALPWRDLPPLYTNICSETVWYKVSSANYTDFVHAARVTITPAMKALKIRTAWSNTTSVAEQPDYEVTVKTNGAAMATYALTAANAWKIDTTTRVHDDFGVTLEYALEVAPIKGFITETQLWGCAPIGNVTLASNVLTRTGWQRISSCTLGTEIFTVDGWSKLSGTKLSTYVAVEYNGEGELFWITNTAHRDIDDGSGGKSGDENAVSYVGVYDGKAHGIDVAVTDPAEGATIRYATTRDGPYVDTLTFKDVCSHVPVWYEIAADGYNTMTNLATVTITPKTLTDEMCVADEDAAWFFDGTEKKPAVTVVDGDPNIATTNDFTLTYSGKTGAGKFPVTITGTNNYTGTVKKEFSILKRPVAPPIIPSSAYNGKTRTPTVPTDSRWTVVSNPGGKNAGEYTNVVLRLTNTTDYKWKGYAEDGPDTWTGVFVIRKAANGWSAYPDMKSWTYGETPSEPQGRPRYGTLSVAYRTRGAAVETESSERPSEIGLYTARFWVEATQNYAGVASREVDFEIKDPNPSGATTTTPVPVPHSWLDKYVAEFGGDRETAGNATGRNGRPLWESYVAGLDPTDENSQFTATISIGSDGVPEVTWSPNLSDGNPPRSYTTVGKENLDDEAWTPVTDENRGTMKFFKVEVNIE